MTLTEAAKKLAEPRLSPVPDRQASAGWRRDRNARKRARKALRAAGGRVGAS